MNLDEPWGRTPVNPGTAWTLWHLRRAADAAGNVDNAIRRNSPEPPQTWQEEEKEEDLASDDDPSNNASPTPAVVDRNIDPAPPNVESPDEEDDDPAPTDESSATSATIRAPPRTATTRNREQMLDGDEDEDDDDRPIYRHKGESSPAAEGEDESEMSGSEEGGRWSISRKLSSKMTNQSSSQWTLSGLPITLCILMNSSIDCTVQGRKANTGLLMQLLQAPNSPENRYIKRHSILETRVAVQ